MLPFHTKQSRVDAARPQIIRIADLIALNDSPTVELLQLILQVLDRQLGIGQDGFLTTTAMTGSGAGEKTRNPVTTAGSIAVHLLGFDQEALAQGSADLTRLLTRRQVCSRGWDRSVLYICPVVAAELLIRVEGVGVLLGSWSA